VKAVPKKIKRDAGRGIAIQWTSGAESFISNKILRQNCPCATCAEARGDLSHAKPLGAKKSSLNILKSSIDEETNLLSIDSVGNYAMSCTWADGHSTGIYSYDYLKKLTVST